MPPDYTAPTLVTTQQPAARAGYLPTAILTFLCSFFPKHFPHKIPPQETNQGTKNAFQMSPSPFLFSHLCDSIHGRLVGSQKARVCYVMCLYSVRLIWWKMWKALYAVYMTGAGNEDRLFHVFHSSL